MADEAPVPNAAEGAALAAADFEAWQRTRLVRRVEHLDGAADSSLAVSRAIQGRIEVTAPDAPAEELQTLGAIHAKSTWGLRMATWLESRLIADFHRLQALKADPAAFARSSLARADDDRVWDRKEQIVGVVRRLIEAERGSCSDAEELEVLERLERQESFGRLMSRQPSELIAELCRELGLSPDWSALAKEAGLREEMADMAAAEPPADPMAEPAAEPVTEPEPARAAGPARHEPARVIMAEFRPPRGASP